MEIIIPKNELINLNYSNKNKIIKKKKTKKLFQNCFRIIIYSVILIIIILLFFINLKLNNISFKEKEFKINYYEYKRNFMKNEQQKTSQLNIINSNSHFTQILLKEISKVYDQNGFVNINEVESKIPDGRTWIKGQNKSKEINVGSSLDEKFVLLGMFTIASIMDSQELETKLRLHFAVVEGFSVDGMIKIYTLRDKIRNDVEFNFYNAKKVETDIGRKMNPKGNGLNAIRFRGYTCFKRFIRNV